MTVYVYLNFSEDKSVPDCIPPDNTLIEFCYFSAESQTQQPFLQWCVSLTKYLQRFETSLNSEWQQQLKPKIKTKARVHQGLTLSHMRFSRRGTTGKTVGFSVCRSSIKSRTSPWKKPIRPPWMRMTTWNGKRWSSLSTRWRTQHSKRKIFLMNSEKRNWQYSNLPNILPKCPFNNFLMINNSLLYLLV